MKSIGNDSNGYPIPGVPEPGDPIRVLWAARADMEQQWADAYLIRVDPSGIWWTPADDLTGAMWSPWSHVVEIEGPVYETPRKPPPPPPTM
jgi:hypothetical protein